MIKDPSVVARMAAEREAENWRFASFLRLLARRRSAEIDSLAERLGREAEAAMDCRACGACCRDNHVPVTADEIERLAPLLSLPVLEFRARHVRPDDDGDDAIAARPCPFLVGSLCGVYAQRPEPCRGYPYIGGNVVSRMAGIIERAGTCPIVFEMLERLKIRLAFPGGNNA